jgi:hypothetical protein
MAGAPRRDETSQRSDQGIADTTCSRSRCPLPDNRCAAHPIIVGTVDLADATITVRSLTGKPAPSTDGTPRPARLP